MPLTPGADVTPTSPPERTRPKAYGFTAVICWVVLLIALTGVVVSLSTIVLVPRWINWQIRLLVAGLSGETGYRFAVWLLLIAGLGLLLRRRHRTLATVALSCALLALALTLKPVVQGWWIGQTLPERMTAAFDRSEVDRSPFSFRDLYAPPPSAVPFRDGLYDREHGFEIMPAIGRSPAPVVILLHGGAWFDGGFKDRRPLSLWLVRQGYTVVGVGYSALPDGHWPQQRDDVLRAIAALRAHADRYSIDPNRIVLLGRSAGAQIALATAYAAHDPGIRGVVAFYPPTDFPALWKLIPKMPFQVRGMDARQIVTLFLGGTPETAAANYESASALALAGRDSPPTLLIHGTLDSLVPISQSEALDRRLSVAGCPHLLLTIPWASHGFDTINFDGPGGQLSTYAVGRFLASVTR